MEANNNEQSERKTLDDRNKMTDLERLRHSCAHVMATAILRLWPDAQFAAGPPVENGFYYDVDLQHRITPEDFPTIEAEMKKEIKANRPFEKVVVTREQAIKDSESGRLGGLSERPGNPSKFKLGNLEGIPEGEPITYFKSGDFIDLCAGPHVMRTGNIGAYKLTSVASAYYKGDEKNPQLQRIYGTAFKNKTELEAYFKMLEEAKRRDHRKIGQEMGLFTIDADFTGPGLPLWLPKGGAMVEELEKLAKETEFLAGYVRVKTPPAVLRGVDVSAYGAGGGGRPTGQAFPGVTRSARHPAEAGTGGHWRRGEDCPLGQATSRGRGSY
jgi:threonyl-tRNA synthetase